MDFGLFDLLKLIGALGFFIFGMKVMSEGIQKVAGENLRKILGIMTKNRLLGVFTGFSVTSIVQSSSATTVMLVSFVNAGLLSLRQAIGVIMGANIGTTVTAVIITVFGFSKFKIATYALPIIGIAFPLMFSKNDKLKSFSEFLVGFALLFMGLDELKHSVPEFNAESLHFLMGMNDLGFLSPLIFVLIGTLLTIVIQSSSAAMALTLVLCERGVIQFDMAAAIVLGENIGTTITANLAAVIANYQAKRAARAHFIFNVIGVIWMLLVFPWYLKGIDSYIVSAGMESPFHNTASVKWALTLFHISFNVINTFLLIWFVPQIEAIVSKLVKPSTEEKSFTLEYISSGLMSTPELSILQAKKEIIKYGDITHRMLKFSKKLFTSKDKKESERLLKRISKYEQITDKIEIEVSDYLLKLTNEELSAESSRMVRGMFSIIGDLERIADIFFQISQTIKRKQKEKIWFTPEQRNNILQMFKLVDKAFEIMIENLQAEDWSKVSIDTALEAEKTINEFRDKIRKEHVKALSEHQEEINVLSGIIYTDLFSSLEKIGDHIINVSEGVTGKF
ncbi:MAG: Na/Pi cotransporter family protein [Bacteroidetes bacterium]|nr:MAG: Na/Pi cotransporter family protein [Bacteroidota bacterium]